MTLDLSTIRAALFDMDGVLYRNSLALPGARELLAWLDGSQIPYICITNNASQLPSEYSARLSIMGIPVPPERILTSSLIASRYLRSVAPQGTPVYAVGMQGLLEPLFGDGYFVFTEHQPGYVVVGADFELTYAKLRTACFAIRAGATFIGTNPDLTFPTEQGLAPGAGSILAALQAATGVAPLVLGKPQPEMFRSAMALLGTSPANTLVVGDSLVTDVQGAANMGMPTVLVLSGVTGAADLALSPIQPAAVFDHCAALLAAWQG